MLFDEQTLANEYSKYKNYLELFSSLSYLFSDSDIPYLHYRVMENIFCESFGAKNLSRTDTAFDARKVINGKVVGVGLKTFAATLSEDNLKNFKNEKIAEFNKESVKLNGLSIKDVTYRVAELRNARIASAKKEYGVEHQIYHCVIRYCDDAGKVGKLLLKEFEYEPININNIICTDRNYNPLSESELNNTFSDILFFKDGKECYSFNKSKSTLFKRFNTNINEGTVLSVEKIDNPYDELLQWFSKIKLGDKSVPGKDYIVLPLYAVKNNRKYVPAKSGLNQWLAGGRKRKFGEMYIPVPMYIYQNCNSFFPNKNEVFELVTPDDTIINVKLCQDNGKALMSYPNDLLSNWFHPLLMRSNSHSIVDYDDLTRIGKDAVRIEKLACNKYKFSLAPMESWENFKEDIKNIKEKEMYGKS